MKSPAIVPPGCVTADSKHGGGRKWGGDGSLGLGWGAGGECGQVGTYLNRLQEGEQRTAEDRWRRGAGGCMLALRSAASPD